MLKMIHVRNSIIIVLCIAIILLGIGFMVLSIKLKDISNDEHTFRVIFSDIEKISSVKGSSQEPRSSAEISPDGGKVNFRFTLGAVHDEVVYQVTIKNVGTLPAEIVDVIESPDYNEAELKKIISPVSLTISDLKGKIIPASGKTKVKITAYYNSFEGEKPTKDFNYHLSFVARSAA